ncbi:hypothetical protein NB311A_05058 [Nitrobacter sp. Nb-311A]|nr:hypothetical protein NB311A_05058 [Nitrobacter sp. Nb-311A]
MTVTEIFNWLDRAIAFRKRKSAK